MATHAINDDCDCIAALETRIAALEKQVAYLTERDNEERKAEQGMIDILEGKGMNRGGVA